MNQLGKIDGLVGSKNVGAIVDFHNEAVDKKKERNYLNEMNARNKYFLPLWKRAIEELRSGFRADPKKKKPKVYGVKGPDKIYLPNAKPVVVK